MKIHHLIVVAAVLVGMVGQAQPFNFAEARQPVVSLDVPWRFHAGDDQSWASPRLDDSGWSQLQIDHSWQDPEVFQAGGSCWYRLQVQVPADHPPLALLIPHLYSSYQVFANGTSIGGLGGMPPNAVVLRRNLDNLLLPIPQEVINGSGELTLALRIWHWTRYKSYPGTEEVTVLLGDQAYLTTQQTLIFHDAFWHSSDQALVAYASLLTTLTGLALFVLRRREPLYFWFALYALFGCIRVVQDLSTNLTAIPYLLSFGLSHTLLCLQGVSGIVFISLACGFPRKFHFWAAVLSYAAVLLSIPLLFFSAIDIPTLAALATLPAVLARVLYIAILVRSVRNGSTDARLLLGPIAFYLCALSVDDLIADSWQFGNLALSLRLDWFSHLITWPVPISCTMAANLLQQAALVAVLIYRFVRSREDEEKWKTEFEAAASVQQVLVPAEIPSIPSFAIEAVYKPAGEVGGDFYQVVPTPSGGVLAVVGDVSGKGMPAAMTVSLLVGTVRTLAHYTESPGEILAALNQRMIGRNNGGFTTCLVLRIDPAGMLTGANAGHLAPYRDGEEVPLESGLPLGIVPDTRYSETTLTLTAGDRLTFLSDGVVEARNGDGELFGFDRTRQISTQSAEAIAHAAQAYGQEDDITVLTLTFAPAEVIHA